MKPKRPGLLAFATAVWVLLVLSVSAKAAAGAAECDQGVLTLNCPGAPLATGKPASCCVPHQDVPSDWQWKNCCCKKSGEPLS